MAEQYLPFSDSLGRYDTAISNWRMTSRNEIDGECGILNIDKWQGVSDWTPRELCPPSELSRLRRDSEALGRVREVVAHHRRRIECWVGRVPTARAVIETIESAIADAGEGES